MRCYHGGLLRRASLASMLWTSQGRGRWPDVPPPGPVDEAADLLIRLVFFNWPQARLMARLRHGVGHCAGRQPLTEPAAAAAVGWTRSTTVIATTRLRDAARVGGPPASLQAAVDVLQHVTPASPALLALRLWEARVTTGVLDPRSITGLAALWGVPAPHLHPLRRSSVTSVALGTRGESDPMPAVADAVRSAGVLPVHDAVTLTLWPARWDDRQRLDLLHWWQLFEPGSPVVWDRLRSGRLLRPLQRMLAACGPLAVEDVVHGLHRTRHTNPAITPGPPDRSVLLAWAAEHPGFTVADDLLHLTVRTRQAALLLTPADRVIVARLRRRRDVPVSEMHTLLVEKGHAANRNVAKTLLTMAPYVVSTGRGAIGLRRSSGRAGAVTGPSESVHRSDPA